MKNFLNKIKNLIINHKKISIIFFIILIILGYWIYKKTTDTSGQIKYITTEAKKGTIISSVSGSGQVSALNELNIQPEVSGNITSINTSPGDYVFAGKLLFTLDDTDAKKTVRNAEISLQNGQISLAKLQLQNSSANLNSDLAKAYDDGFNSVSNTFLDLPSITNGLTNMFYKSDSTGRMYINIYSESVGPADKDTAISFRENADIAYNLAIKEYNETFILYKNTKRTASNTEIENLINQTYNTTKLVSDAIKSFNNYIDFVNDSMQRYNYNQISLLNTHKNNLNTYTAETNSHLQSLLSNQTSIKNSKDAFETSDLDIQSSRLSLSQQENSLSDAKDNLLKYKIYAPFNGIVASVPVNKGDNAGSGTTLATIITTKKIATISLNEVDIAKIRLGQKVTLTFDAIPNLTITGKVAEIDSIGTVSQGVVTYNVKISFDTNDGEIKPGMSVNASIITGTKQDVITVPNGAIKTKGTTTYVETFASALPKKEIGASGSVSENPPTQTIVEIGITNDTSTEIISGLKVGDIIVTKTISNTTKTNSAPSIFNAATNNRGGGIR